MSSSNSCFLTCIQVSQEAGQVVWYSHLFQNFPQLIVIHTVKGFGIVNKAEINVFLELSCFFDDPADVGYKEEVTKQYYSIISLFFLISFFFLAATHGFKTHGILIPQPGIKLVPPAVKHGVLLVLWLAHWKSLTFFFFFENVH